MPNPRIRDQEVVLWNSTGTRTGRFWESGPWVLVFPGHYGWPFSRDQVAQLRQKADGYKRHQASELKIQPPQYLCSAGACQAHHNPLA